MIRNKFQFPSFISSLDIASELRNHSALWLLIAYDTSTYPHPPSEAQTELFILSISLTSRSSDDFCLP